MEFCAIRNGLPKVVVKLVRVSFVSVWLEKVLLE